MKFRPQIQLLTRAILMILASALLPASGQTANLLVANAGFENTTGQSTFNEFTFGMPAAWNLYDPNNIISSYTGPFYLGTLDVEGNTGGTAMDRFFNDATAPEGNRVGILYGSTNEGAGEYGFEQTLTGVTLQAFTQYTLTVEVGNIGSGNGNDNTFFNLSEFPGYRIQLLAGGIELAADNNSLTITEGEFAAATVIYTTGASPVSGDIGIRLINMNAIPDGFTQGTSPDLEVDFDNVQLDATAIPEPSTILLGIGGFALLLLLRFTRVRKNESEKD